MKERGLETEIHSSLWTLPCGTKGVVCEVAKKTFTFLHTVENKPLANVLILARLTSDLYLFLNQDTQILSCRSVISTF